MSNACGVNVDEYYLFWHASQLNPRLSQTLRQRTSSPVNVFWTSARWGPGVWDNGKVTSYVNKSVHVLFEHKFGEPMTQGNRNNVLLMPNRRLEGKVALVTGAASGIGEATVRLFAEHGAFVVAADVQDELGREVAASITSNTVTYHHCDVRDEKQVQETVNYTLKKYGTLDILFSNAGILGPFSGILHLDLNEFDNTMAINVRGIAATIKHVARTMVEKNVRGSIICTASLAASIAGAGPHAYTTSKHALLGLVRSVCGELGAHGIRVNCVSPAAVATPLVCTPLNVEPRQVEAATSSKANLKGVVLKTTHIAEAALFLASDDSVYISGHNLVVDGGISVVKNLFSKD